MRFVVYGAGAIGGGIGARLFQHGHDVTLIARGAHLERMRHVGLNLRTPAEDTILPIPVAEHPAELAFTGEEIVILTMKSQDTVTALEELRAVGGSPLTVVCAQNGVVNEREAARRFDRVYGMLVFMPATFLRPGVVTVQAHPVGGVLDCGRYPDGIDGAAEEICAALESSGFSARPQPDIMRFKYAKLITNLGNAVQALCGLDAPSGDLIRALRAEAYACFDAAGTDYLSADEMRAHVAHLQYGEVDGATRGGGSSWQSLARGSRSIEADYLNGEITLLGRLHGVPTPMNRAVQDLAVRAAREGRAPGSVDVGTVMAEARRRAASVEA